MCIPLFCDTEMAQLVEHSTSNLMIPSSYPTLIHGRHRPRRGKIGTNHMDTDKNGIMLLFTLCVLIIAIRDIMLSRKWRL